MKLTQCLQRQHLGWWFKQKWKYQGNRRIVEMWKIPETIREGQIEVVDALKYLRPEATCSESENFTPSQDEMMKNHEDFHERQCYFFMPETNLLEGEAHVQVLTKSLIIQGLPKRLQTLYDKIDVKHLDEVAQNLTKNALLFDSTQKKLPKIVDKDRPWHKFAAVFGIPVQRKITSLLNSYVRLANMCAMKDPNAINRDLVENVQASASLEKDGDLIQFRVKAEYMLTSPEPLLALADENEVVATLDQPLPDIYPLKSTLDLKSENIYKICDFLSIPTSQTQRCAHTLILHAPPPSDDWSRSQILARAIGTCHGFALAQSRRSFGNVTELPHPITVQCIQSDSRVFDFIVYQLNTLNQDGVDGLKNIAWLDSHNLYDHCEMVHFKKYLENFNLDVIRRFFTLYFNGLQM